MTIFYTIQTEEFWHKCLKTKKFVANSEFVHADDVIAYTWMTNQAQKRLKNYNKKKDKVYPIWLWIKKPNLREKALLPPKTKGVLITVNLDIGSVLLSDFQAWHCVLNNWTCSVNAKEDKFLENCSQEFKEKTWERIFELDLIKKSGYYGPQIIQGVIQQIHMNDILKVQEFVAK